MVSQVRSMANDISTGMIEGLRLLDLGSRTTLSICSYTRPSSVMTRAFLRTHTPPWYKARHTNVYSLAVLESSRACHQHLLCLLAVIADSGTDQHSSS